MSKTVIWIITGIFAVIISIVLLFDMFPFNNGAQRTTDSYTIVKKWELPKILTEVSDISWIKDDVIAAVQDEDGIVFLYNLKSSEIIKKIAFGGSGDYEGLAVDGNTIFVLRSDGKIFEIKNFDQENFEVKTYETPLTEEQDVEGLALDKENNRLLLAIKEEEPGDKNYKGIYAFDLESKKLRDEPVLKIKFDDPIFKEVKPDKKTETIKPSEIALRPSTGQLFVLDASIPMLVVYDMNGNSQEIYFFAKDEFAQPEGLTFDTSGKLYISNEGDDGPGNILQVELGN